MFCVFVAHTHKHTCQTLFVIVVVVVVVDVQFLVFIHLLLFDGRFIHFHVFVFMNNFVVVRFTVFLCEFMIFNEYFDINEKENKKRFVLSMPAHITFIVKFNASKERKKHSNWILPFLFIPSKILLYHNQAWFLMHT